MICPKCESENCHFVSQSSTSNGSFCNGCCGFIFLGPIGILCGLCGHDTDTKEFWVCDNCGCKFQRGLERKSQRNVQTIPEQSNISIESNYANNAKKCPQCGKSLNALGNCNFCGYKK